MASDSIIAINLLCAPDLHLHPHFDLIRGIKEVVVNDGEVILETHRSGGQPSC